MALTLPSQISLRDFQVSLEPRIPVRMSRPKKRRWYEEPQETPREHSSPPSQADEPSPLTQQVLSKSKKVSVEKIVNKKNTKTTSKRKRSPSPLPQPILVGPEDGEWDENGLVWHPRVSQVLEMEEEARDHEEGNEVPEELEEEERMLQESADRDDLLRLSGKSDYQTETVKTSALIQANHEYQPLLFQDNDPAQDPCTNLEFERATEVLGFEYDTQTRGAVVALGQLGMGEIIQIVDSFDRVMSLPVPNPPQILSPSLTSSNPQSSLTMVDGNHPRSDNTLVPPLHQEEHALQISSELQKRKRNFRLSTTVMNTPPRSPSLAPLPLQEILPPTPPKAKSKKVKSKSSGRKVKTFSKKAPRAWRRPGLGELSPILPASPWPSDSAANTALATINPINADNIPADPPHHITKTPIDLTLSHPLPDSQPVTRHKRPGTTSMWPDEAVDSDENRPIRKRGRNGLPPEQRDQGLFRSSDESDEYRPSRKERAIPLTKVFSIKVDRVRDSDTVVDDDCIVVPTRKRHKRRHKHNLEHPRTATTFGPPRPEVPTLVMTRGNDEGETDQCFFLQYNIPLMIRVKAYLRNVMMKRYKSARNPAKVIPGPKKRRRIKDYRRNPAEVAERIPSYVCQEIQRVSFRAFADIYDPTRSRRDVLNARELIIAGRKEQRDSALGLGRLGITSKKTIVRPITRRQSPIMGLDGQDDGIQAFTPSVNTTSRNRNVPGRLNAVHKNLRPTRLRMTTRTPSPLPIPRRRHVSSETISGSLNGKNIRTPQPHPAPSEEYVGPPMVGYRSKRLNNTLGLENQISREAGGGTSNRYIIRPAPDGEYLGSPKVRVSFGMNNQDIQDTNWREERFMGDDREDPEYLRVGQSQPYQNSVSPIIVDTQPVVESSVRHGSKSNIPVTSSSPIHLPNALSTINFPDAPNRSERNMKHASGSKASEEVLRSSTVLEVQNGKRPPPPSPTSSERVFHEWINTDLFESRSTRPTALGDKHAGKSDFLNYEQLDELNLERMKALVEAGGKRANTSAPVRSKRPSERKHRQTTLNFPSVRSTSMHPTTKVTNHISDQAANADKGPDDSIPILVPPSPAIETPHQSFLFMKNKENRSSVLVLNDQPTSGPSASNHSFSRSRSHSHVSGTPSQDTQHNTAQQSTHEAVQSYPTTFQRSSSSTTLPGQPSKRPSRTRSQGPPIAASAFYALPRSRPRLRGRSVDDIQGAFKPFKPLTQPSSGQRAGIQGVIPHRERGVVPACTVEQPGSDRGSGDDGNEHHIGGVGGVGGESHGSEVKRNRNDNLGIREKQEYEKKVQATKGAWITR
ncbi:hypothetical protein TREMEDRAFT_58852 [Tremella mesenterica DSM 1558]|uniref:uncharacterized protein n=1 Tax=Tremella mesenterica (strain ATCC 24925 / CBS 8224 / DSM 1558 / NBRC 9311 / NRRL Y-6157 / RJB 2259-6 / UBC 559-6) TaxID=578456 RepID=UPI0003F4965F|nr:uncharacterized protein TREMEDRAFT_58852 [Tremella mesenterica DSM 1558]EIW72682.1 hypothetical protein TREMEDRAFT_58852 [Tremella mesenterica DSM 1558]